MYVKCEFFNPCSSVKDRLAIAIISALPFIERRKIMRVFGAKVILTPAAERGTGMVRKAEELAKKHGWFLARQFENEANPAYHRIFEIDSEFEFRGLLDGQVADLVPLRFCPHTRASSSSRFSRVRSETPLYTMRLYDFPACARRHDPRTARRAAAAPAPRPPHFMLARSSIST